MKKIKYLFVAVAALISGTAMAQKITCADVTIAQGGTADLVFKIADTEQLATLAEFTLTLPEGIKIQSEDDEYNYERGDMLQKSHTVTVTDKADGGVYFLTKNESGKDFKSATGTLVTLPIECGNIVSGTYTINVTKANIVANIDNGGKKEATPIIEETAKAFDITVTVGTTGIEDVNGAEAALENGKYEKDGQVFIVKDGKKYTTVGTSK